MSQLKTKIIKSVVQIILKHAKPERIYLCGSQVTGEANNTSDIDIAYDAAILKTNILFRKRLPGQIT